MRGFVMLACLLLPGCLATRPADPGRQVTHVVVVWAKQPGDEAVRRRLVEKSVELEDRIPGLERVTIGPPLPSTDRPGVDASFDLLIVMTFADEAALRAYESHPEHQRAVSEVLRPLAGRVVVYDAKSRTYEGGRPLRRSSSRPPPPPRRRRRRARATR